MILFFKVLEFQMAWDYEIDKFLKGAAKNNVGNKMNRG